MELVTITEVTKRYHISTRTLRYYEQLGLLVSSKKEGYAYRTYDADALKRLEQILVLRKFRIPLKDIQRVLRSEGGEAAQIAFQAKLHELSDEIATLTSLKAALERLAGLLHEQNDMDSSAIIAAHEWQVSPLQLRTNNTKEEFIMETTNCSDYDMNPISMLKDVRIVYLPPSYVASIHSNSETPESDSSDQMRQFVKESKLDKIKPDFRHYGFNHPEGAKHSYERWVTIPEHMEVKAPFVKKHFSGGMYAAHMIPMGNFDEWSWLTKWVESSSQYEHDAVEPNCLEEHLNYINQYQLNDEELHACTQLDLLLPIRSRE